MGIFSNAKQQKRVCGLTTGTTEKGLGQGGTNSALGAWRKNTRVQHGWVLWGWYVGEKRGNSWPPHELCWEPRGKEVVFGKHPIPLALWPFTGLSSPWGGERKETQGRLAHRNGNRAKRPRGGTSKTVKGAGPQLRNQKQRGKEEVRRDRPGSTQRQFGGPPGGNPKRKKSLMGKKNAEGYGKRAGIGMKIRQRTVSESPMGSNEKGCATAVRRRRKIGTKKVRWQAQRPRRSHRPLKGTCCPQADPAPLGKIQLKVSIPQGIHEWKPCR